MFYVFIVVRSNTHIAVKSVSVKVTAISYVSIATKNVQSIAAVFLKTASKPPVAACTLNETYTQACLCQACKPQNMRENTADNLSP